jgi:hypothetical protein
MADSPSPELSGSRALPPAPFESGGMFSIVRWKSVKEREMANHGVKTSSIGDWPIWPIPYDDKQAAIAKERSAIREQRIAEYVQGGIALSKSLAAAEPALRAEEEKRLEDARKTRGQQAASVKRLMPVI